MNEGAVRDAQRLAGAFVVAAARSADPIAVAVGERMMGFSLHFAGDQGAAQIHLERMLGDHVPRALGKGRSHAPVRPVGDGTNPTCGHPVAEGISGSGDAPGRKRLDEAIAINHAVTLCNVLAQGACPVAMLTGDLKSAERYVAMLSENAAQAGLEFWKPTPAASLLSC